MVIEHPGRANGRVTKTPERMAEIMAVFDIESLSPEELQAIAEAGREKFFRKWE